MEAKTMEDETRIRADVTIDMKFPYTREEISEMDNEHIQGLICLILSKMDLHEIEQTIKLDTMECNTDGIKPCPFCGGAPKVVQDMNVYSVECSECEGQIGGWYFHKEDAINEWNQRSWE